MEEKSVIATKARNGAGWIKLNRPQALHALSKEMIDSLLKTLKEWKEDDTVAFICLHSEGEKAFCAGGDIRSFYNVKKNAAAYAKSYITAEYTLDYEIHNYPKPILVYMNGIVMGGGVGLSIGASHRIVTEKTKWAMPEMTIGFFPDVGSSSFLNNMPGCIGRYLALTANSIDASDTLYTGAADYYIERHNWPELKRAINEKPWTLHSSGEDINELLKYYCSPVKDTSNIERHEEQINKHFRFNSLEEIILSLKLAAAEGDGWALETVNTMLSKSPTSLKVTLRQLQEGKQKSLQACFVMEMDLAMNFFSKNEVYEGIRSVLVDKDHKPNWSPSEIEDVSEEDVSSYFYYEWEDGQSPLKKAFEGEKIV
ncbi:enoyl-CoA hydratase/isomerase family protein [Bacillus taeanensis]|uniref:3-hydroxyisobutyryl-CoA hydrolase n=1 Tax=Bacillus taeanensis TaxID=273032 RepID=A0A366XY72_9BACI|nr:enoyl-CoA hydratase/isomerase family protein [Bacillus taeanensis]RBW70095.1 enoyl-CoA hydratase/isomerase family protein [Bacillus taeanensis]